MRRVSSSTSKWLHPSAKKLRDGLLAALSFNIVHYAIRPWPWILTALAVVVLYPDVVRQDPADAYLHAVATLLPAGVAGLVLASLLAAYMSTVAAHLNWGASYLVNDVYVRLLDRTASELRRVAAARAATVLTFLLSAAVTWWLYGRSIEAAWRVLIALGAGTGLVHILRWYWWRINAWSEIAAMTAAVLAVAILVGSTGACLAVIGALGYSAQGACPLDPTTPLDGVYLMVLTTAFTTFVWVGATFLTRPTQRATLLAFYRRVRPGGPGWRRIAVEAGFGRERIAGGALSWSNWVAGVVSIYAMLFGTARLLFGSRAHGLGYLLLAALAFAWIARNLHHEFTGNGATATNHEPAD